jgi:hypothetical protein
VQLQRFIFESCIFGFYLPQLGLEEGRKGRKGWRKEERRNVEKEEKTTDCERERLMKW